MMTMKSLYKFLEISKQAFFSYLKRDAQNESLELVYITAIEELRELHPAMGAKKMYTLIAHKEMGRDKFIALYMENGFQSFVPRNYHRTTYSSRSAWYSNLLQNKIVIDVNQLWVTDITYFQVGTQTVYLSFIVDVYSRYIIGYHISENLLALSSVECLDKALAFRAIAWYQNLIHHSDKGVQYTSEVYTQRLIKHNISISMCSSPYENAHIERVNGTIKNEYLNRWKPTTFKQAKEMLDKAVYRYNNLRPHQSLKMKTPAQYELELMNLPISQRTPMKIFVESKINKQETNQQLCFEF